MVRKMLSEIDYIRILGMITKLFYYLALYLLLSDFKILLCVIFMASSWFDIGYSFHLVFYIRGIPIARA